MVILTQMEALNDYKTLLNKKNRIGGWSKSLQLPYANEAKF